MSDLFNEAEANAAVGRVLKRCKIIKKGTTMALFKGDDGVIYQVIETEEVSREQLQEVVDDAAQVLTAAQADLNAYDELSDGQPTPQAADPDPADEPVADTPADVNVATSDTVATTDQPAADAQPETPADPATPEAPAVPESEPVPPISIS